MNKINLQAVAFAIVLFGTFFSGCYSFQGISIPPDVNTYYVELFEPQVEDLPPTLPRDFTELLKDKIRRESRLTYNDTDPDIEFSGIITRFEVTPEAPKAEQQIGFNKLTISVNVNFVNNRNEKANWKSSFEFYDLFEPSQNLLDVQANLIDNITKELADRIFNKAFTNW